MSTARARSLRKQMSPPEAKSWTILRRPPFAAYHFRRQVQIGRYYADFASHGARLVVEVDGGAHFEATAEAHDRRRDAALADMGYTVLRLTTSEVLNNSEAAAAAILARLPPPHPATPTLDPSPHGRGRRLLDRARAARKNN